MPPFDDVPLTPTERRLLDALAARGGGVVSKETLQAEVWRLPPGTRSRTLYTTIDRLRKKIEVDPKHPKHLLTIGREGYAFVDEPTSSPAPAPVVRDGLVGRAAELEQVRSALSEGRIVVLHGPAGVGKSALAKHALPAARFCDLTGARTRRDVLDVVAATLMLPTRSDDAAREFRRLARVAAREPGLVLDGAERAAEAVGDLLHDWPDAPPPTIVTTQRALALPDAVLVKLAPLSIDDGVALFVQRAARPGWSAGEERTALEALVAHLDGLPLAIELAARWSRLVAPGELSVRAQQDRLPLVASDDDPRPRRHHSLDAALRWSWHALSPPARRALEALSTARGGVAVADLEPLLGADGLQRVDALAQHALVDGRGGRIHVLGTVARFVRDDLDTRPHDRATAWSRHGRCYARYGEDEALRQRVRDGAGGVLDLAPELGNLAVAMAHGDPDDAGAAALAWAETRRSLGAHAPVADALAPVVRLPFTSDPLRARVWMALGIARRHAGDPDGAFAAFDEAEAWVRDGAQRTELDKVRGTALAYHGAHEDAERYLLRAQQGYQNRHDPYGEGLVLGDLATLDMRAGRLADGVTRLQEALGLLRRASARFAEAVYLGNLGVLQMKLDHFAAAAATYQQALALHRELGSTRFEALTLSNLGLLSALQGRSEEAIEHYRHVIQLASDDGDARDVAIARGNLAWSLVGAGRLVEARRQLDLASDVFDGAQLPYPQTDAALTRSWLSREEGDLEGAEAWLERAEDLATTHDFGEHQAAVVAQRGLLVAARGEVAEARRCLAEATERAAALHLGVGWDGAVYLAQLRDTVGSD